MTREEFDNEVVLYPLSDLLQSSSNRKAKEKLQTFQCSRNKDVEDFLHNRAITFEKNFRAKTYIYIDHSGEIIAYFSIALKILSSQDVSERTLQILGNYPDGRPIHDIPCFLIGQLGKTDSYRDKKIGNFLLQDALDIIDNIQEQIGGRFIMLDAVNQQKIIDFYKNAGFIPLPPNSPSDESVKMIRPYFDLDGDSLE